MVESACLEIWCTLKRTVGSNPTLSAIFITCELGYAKWGGSGALYLQSAIAGLNSCCEA